MRRADRLFQLVQLLRSKRTATGQQLANELGVSKRTVYRDIRDLEIAGVPIRGDVDLPTITGETVVLKIPPGTQPGERLRVRSQGLPRADGYGKGNLLVQVQVEVPTKVNAEQVELLTRFDEIEEPKRKKSNRKKGIFEKVKDIFT